MISPTLCYLLARAPISTMGFSGVTASTSIYLNGPGGQGSPGFPLPRRGYLTALRLWDGTTERWDMDEVAFQAGDRVSVYCQNVGSDFTVKVRLNGVSTTLQTTNVPFNSTLTATVEFMLVRE
jgi:hypothetical protein